MISDAELGAFIDGALPPEAAARVASAISQSPALAERAAAFRQDRDRLKTAFEPWDRDPPARLLRAALEPPPPRSALPRRRAILAGAGGLALASAGLAWMLRARPDDPFARAQALAAAGMPLSPDAARARATRLLGRAPPDLSAAGFSLVAGAVGEPDAVLLAYQGPTRFLLYLAPSRGRDAFAWRDGPGPRACLWENDRIVAVMSADLPRAALFRLASATYLALNA